MAPTLVRRSCPTEITAFSDRVGEFKAIGAEVVAMSVDSKFSHLAWTQLPRTKGGLGEMKIPILADINKTVRAHPAAAVLSTAQPTPRSVARLDQSVVCRPNFRSPRPTAR
jgi:alkyl hydroperoxide reductase subunit AhpC